MRLSVNVYNMMMPMGEMMRLTSFCVQRMPAMGK